MSHLSLLNLAAPSAHKEVIRKGLGEKRALLTHRAASRYSTVVEKAVENGTVVTNIV